MAKKKYEGTYVDKKGKSSKIIVKFDPKRLGILITTGFLIINMIGCSGKKTVTTDEKTMSVEEILDDTFKKNPLLLYDVVPEDYLVYPGRTVTSCAEYAGCSIDEVIRRNKIENPNIIQNGTILKIDKRINLSEEEREIKLLSSYFSDYLFNARIAELAKHPENSEALQHYHNLFYNETNGIYNQYHSASIKFHKDDEPNQLISTKTEEAKKIYLESLQEILDNLNAHGLYEEGINEPYIPYEQYKSFYLNETFGEVSPVKTIQ